MQIFATQSLGPTQSLTPEGYLLCEGVPIARTGSQLYLSSELSGLVGDASGTLTVIRTDDEVFRPETIASFEGKSVTVNHVFVDPGNVRRVEVGHVQNVRRSETEPDLLVADLLIKDERAIDLVRFDPQNPTKKLIREISCGYDAEYVQTEPGVAYQRNIIGNHVALVERGRAGPRCSIQDEEPYIMTTPKKASTLIQRLIMAARTGDVALIRRTADETAEEVAAEEQRAQDEALENERKETKDAIAKLTQTVDALVQTVAKLTRDEDAPELDADGNPIKKPTGDDDMPTEEEMQQTADAFRDVTSKAEILAPGYALPTADSVKRAADLVAAQRGVLSHAIKTADMSAIVTPLLSGRTVDALPAEAVAPVFAAAAMMAAERNNNRGARHSVRTGDRAGAAVTPAEINRRNAEYYQPK